MAGQIIHTLCRRRDSRHGTQPLAAQLWQRSAVTWRAGVLTEAGELDDLSGFTRLELRVVTFGGDGPAQTPWILRSVAAEDFSTPTSADAVRAGAEWHAEILLDSDATNLPVTDNGFRNYWFEWRGIDAAEVETVLSAGQAVMRGTGGGDGAFLRAADAAAQLAAAAALASRMPGLPRAGEVYTLTLGDIGYEIQRSHPTACTFHVPLAPEGDWPEDVLVPVWNDGPGSLTFAAADGVTLKYQPGALLLLTNQLGGLRYRGDNLWNVI